MNGDHLNQEDGPSVKRLRSETNDNPANASPSAVVHVRNLDLETTEADLLEALSYFGQIAYVSCMDRRMALVEFEEMESAKKCVLFAQSTPINVAGSPAVFNFSTSQAIKRFPMESATPNRILSLTVNNVQHQINVDVIKTVCSAYGEILRIVINRKFGVQVLVEYRTADIAKKAKHELNGADIFPRSCTLKVEFAKGDNIVVPQNDSDHWDPALVTGQYAAPKIEKRSLLDEQYFEKHAQITPGMNVPQAHAPFGAMQPRSSFGALQRSDDVYEVPLSKEYGYENYSAATSSYGRPNSHYAPLPPVAGIKRLAPHHPRPIDPYYPSDETEHDQFYPPQPRQSRPEFGHFNRRMPEYPEEMFYDDRRQAIERPMTARHAMDSRHYAESAAAPQFGTVQGGGVIMVYGINRKDFNCDKLFNLFCGFGNCMKIQFMKTKENTAMVEMDCVQGSTNVLRYLNGAKMFGETLIMKPSVKVTMQDAATPFLLPDESPSFVDYTHNRNHRYLSAGAIARNRLTVPTNELHWYNAPPSMNEEKIKKIFEESNTKVPIRVVVFKMKTEKIAAGLAEFASKEDATEALMVCNHYNIEERNDGKDMTYTLKLAFGISTNEKFKKVPSFS